MREKKEYLVLSFQSTAHAMRVEEYCMKHQIAGRLIPVPKDITAGCGLAWRALPEEEKSLLEAFKKADITYDGVYHLML